MDPVEAARRVYAEKLRRSAEVSSEAVVRAFARVPRERFLGPGPWPVFVGDGYRTTENADPRQVYRDILIGIDTSRLLNNGQPSAHARWMDCLDPRPGERVVHIGSGTGYYSAVLAEAVGAQGRVLALEIAPELAARAKQNLAPYPQVEVACADGSTHDLGAADGIYVNGGATHVPASWLDALRDGGRLVLPLVRWPSGAATRATPGTGVMLRVARSGAECVARLVSLVGIFPCIGVVDPAADQRLGEAFARGARMGAEYAVRRERHEREPRCWLHGDDVCLWSTSSGGD